MAGVPQTLQIPPPVSIQTMLYNTYLQIIGGGNAPFVGPLDALVAQGASVARAYSCRRLLSSYTGSASVLRGNGTGSPEATINYLSNGALDLAAATTIATQDGGTGAFWKTWNDQGGSALNATQTTAARQPPFTAVIRTKGALGGLASTDTYLNFTLSPAIPRPFFVFLILTAGATTDHYVFGTTSTTSRYLRFNGSLNARFNWGVNLDTAGFEMFSVSSVGVLSNGANSVIYNNGTATSGVGNAGTTTSMTSWRIGSAGTSASSWFTDAANTISEMIVFNGDPTGLAGWSAFESAARAYYA